MKLKGYARVHEREHCKEAEDPTGFLPAFLLLALIN